MATIGQAATGLTQMSALELAQAIRSKRVSSQDVIEAHLQRIEAVNPQSTLSPSSSARKRCKEQSKLTKP